MGYLAGHEYVGYMFNGHHRLASEVHELRLRQQHPLRLQRSSRRTRARQTQPMVHPPRGFAKTTRATPPCLLPTAPRAPATTPLRAGRRVSPSATRDTQSQDAVMFESGADLKQHAPQPRAMHLCRRQTALSATAPAPWRVARRASRNATRDIMPPVRAVVPWERSSRGGNTNPSPPLSLLSPPSSPPPPPPPKLVLDDDDAANAPRDLLGALYRV